MEDAMKDRMTAIFLLILAGFSLSAEAVGFETVRFEADTFIMGSPEDDRYRDDDVGEVEVSINRAFEMGKYEVTQRQWVKVMGENPSHFRTSEYCDNHTTVDGVGMCPDHPVERVSRSDVKEFFRRLNEREGNTGCGGNSRAEGLPETADGGGVGVRREGGYGHWVFVRRRCGRSGRLCLVFE